MRLNVVSSANATRLTEKQRPRSLEVFQRLNEHVAAMAKAGASLKVKAGDKPASKSKQSSSKLTLDDSQDEDSFDLTQDQKPSSANGQSKGKKRAAQPAANDKQATRKKARVSVEPEPEAEDGVANAQREELEQLRESYAQAKEAFEQLAAKRNAAADQIASLTKSSNARVAKLQVVVDKYKAELEALRTSAANVSTSTSGPSQREKELEAQVETLKKAQSSEANVTKSASKKGAAAQPNADVANLEAKLRERDAEVERLKLELAQEVAMSKQMAATKSKPAPFATFSAPSSTNAVADSEALAMAKLTNEMSADMTGLLVQNARRTETGTAADCVLTSILDERLALPFMVTLHPDQSVSYLPRLEEGRDDEVMSVLEHKYQSLIRLLDGTQLPRLFRKLFQQLNSNLPAK